jgi:hypothetical protein
MITITDIPDDDLILARLVCRKMAKLLGGMLSVGLSSLQLDSPESFLAGRDKLIPAMVEVVCHTGVRPGSESAFTLNERTTRLSRLVDDFFIRFRVLSGWRSMAQGELNLASSQLATVYSASLTELQELLQDLQSPTDYRQQQIKGQALISGVVADLSRRL